MERIYLDHNASSPLLPEIAQKLSQWATEYAGNPSSAHSSGAKARDAIEAAREDFAEAIGATDAGQIIFTSGATEANALAILGRLRHGTENRKKILVSAIEHPSVLRNAELAAKELNLKLELLPVNSNGVLNLDAARKAIDTNTAMVALMLVNNEIGTIQPVEEVRDLCLNAGAWLHVDAVQGLGKIPLNIDSLGADSASFSAHKLGGLKGAGALYLRDRKEITPHIAGGGQEFTIRPGTENTLGILSLAEAAKIRTEQIDSFILQVGKYRDDFEDQLAKTPGIQCEFIGKKAHRVAQTSSVRFIGVDSSVLLDILDQQGIECSNGSACSSGTVSPSHVLLAMERSQQACSETLRFSFGAPPPFNSE